MELNEIIKNDTFIGIFRILLSLVIAGFVGFERKLKNHPAGSRTYMLVCVGSTMVMLMSLKLSSKFPNFDITRMGSQVISGIGFLGVGTIITTQHNRVRGLSTAAGLWCIAIIGLLIGTGMYEFAIVGAAAQAFIMIFLKKFYVFKDIENKYFYITIITEAKTNINEIIDKCSDRGFKIIDFFSEDNNSSKFLHYYIYVKAPLNLCENASLEYIGAIDGVIYVEKIKD